MMMAEGWCMAFFEPYPQHIPTMFSLKHQILQQNPIQDSTNKPFPNNPNFDHYGLVGQYTHPSEKYGQSQLGWWQKPFFFCFWENKIHGNQLPPTSYVP